MSLATITEIDHFFAELGSGDDELSIFYSTIDELALDGQEGSRDKLRLKGHQPFGTANASVSRSSRGSPTIDVGCIFATFRRAGHSEGARRAV
jgi:hypothetical protein